MAPMEGDLRIYCDDRKWGWKILTEDDLTKY